MITWIVVSFRLHLLLLLMAAIQAKLKFIHRGGSTVAAFTDFHEIASIHAPVNLAMRRSEIVVGQELRIEGVRYRVYEVFTVLLNEIHPNDGSGGVSSSVKGSLHPYNTEILYYLDCVN